MHANLVEGLSLGLVGLHSTCQPDRKLLPLHGKRIDVLTGGHGGS